MTMKRIITHPITLATLLVIVTPFLIVSYWLAVFLAVG